MRMMKKEVLALAVLVSIPFWLAILTVVCGCTATLPPSVTERAEDAVETALAHMDEVEAFLRAAEAGPELLEEIEGFAAAYESQEYVTALSHLRGGLQVLRAAEVPIPAEVTQHMSEAERLLAFLGQQ